MEAQSCERELDQHAALRAHELVPFVDDDEPKVGEDVAARRRASSSSDERLRRRDERRRQSAALSRAHRGGRVAGAGLERPRDAEIVERLAECFLGVGGERAEWRDPEDAQRAAIGRGALELRIGRRCALGARPLARATRSAARPTRRASCPCRSRRERGRSRPRGTRPTLRAGRRTASSRATRTTSSSRISCRSPTTLDLACNRMRARASVAIVSASSGRLVRSPPENPRKPHGDARLVSRRRLNSLEAELEHVHAASRA